jgi:peptidoglycan hydrolase-like protein with peptidoglycan-binding domain
VEFASPKPLSLAGSVGTAAASGAGDQGAEQRVTKAPVAGTVVKEGDVLMTVNGRPVFALRGSVPMYRALGPGASGDDVTQLQKALRRLGSDPGSISGTFRQGTAAAVTDWYGSKGYEAQQPSPDDQQQLGSLEQAVSAAQEALLTAGAGGGDSSPGPESGTDKQIREIQLGSAKKSLDLANAALSTFKTSYGTKVPAGEVVFFPKLPVRLDKVTVKAGDSVSGQIGTVTSSDLVVEAVVPGTDAELLRQGMAAEVLTDDGKKAQGTVSALGADATSAATTGESESSQGESGGTAESTESADATSTDSSAPVQLRISIADPGQLAGEADASVKVTIKVGASDGEVLTVPLAAIHTSSDGRARVQVQRAGGLTDVHVTVGLSAAGLVEVKPAGGTLKQGDRVVVGK